MVLQSTSAARKGKRCVSAGTVREGYRLGETFESGLEGSPGIHPEQKGGDGHPRRRKTWLSSERMGLLRGKYRG